MRLRHRVKFNQQTDDNDAYGNPKGGWEELFTVWGNIREITGKEHLKSGSVEGISIATFRVRGSSKTRQITSGDQAVARGKTWNLEAQTYIEGGGAFIDIRDTSGGAQ